MLMELHYFNPLEKADFLALEHADYLKGLLTPFKGKGCLENWEAQCLAVRDGLIDLAQTRILTQARHYPFNLLPAQLTPHITRAGTTFLRWRNPERTTMGVALWQRCVESEATPTLLLNDLLALEQQRIVLNMQISLSHAMAKCARECAAKMAQAESIHLRCVDQRTIRLETPK